MTRTILAAATAALIAATGAASAQQVELVTGVGFGQTKTEAQAYSIQGWVIQAIKDYGDGDWNSAARFGMECMQLSGGGGYATMGIGIGGNPVGAKWSCTVRGLPAAANG